MTFQVAFFDELEKLAAFKEFSRTIDHLSPPAFERVHGGQPGIKTRQQLRDSTAKVIRGLRSGTLIDTSKQKGIVNKAVAGGFKRVAKNAMHGNTRSFRVFKKSMTSLNDKFDGIAKTNPHLLANAYHRGQGLDTLVERMRQK